MSKRRITILTTLSFCALINNITAYAYSCRRCLSVTFRCDNNHNSLGHLKPMFEDRVRSNLSMVLRYEDAAVREKAKTVIPIKRLEAEAAEAIEVSLEMEESSIPCYTDVLIECLAVWFKTEFFSWVNSPSCWNCGRDSTVAIGYRQPTAAELRHDANRVEEYRCPQCSAVTSFPRYNDVTKLMETRRGRCGEWANVFTCFCRCLDVEARFVVDWTDHVWTEYFSPERQRWIHADCCECILDKPALYESGWRKKLSYVIAIDRFGATDVTRRYVLDWNATLSLRTEIDEQRKEEILHQFRRSMRKGLTLATLQEIEARDEDDRRDLLDSLKHFDSEEALPSRTTGSAEWRQNRGESRHQKDQSALRVSTVRYRRVVLPDQNTAIVRAAGENVTNGETVACLFDGKSTTKWLDFGGGWHGGSTWVEITVPKRAEPIVLSGYALVSANDSPERDPAEWELQGKADGTDQWITLDCQRNFFFSSRQELVDFDIPSTQRYRQLRLCIWKTRQPFSANAVQLAQFVLLRNESISSKPMEENTTVMVQNLEGKMKDLFQAFS